MPLSLRAQAAVAEREGGFSRADGEQVVWRWEGAHDGPAPTLSPQTRSKHSRPPPKDHAGRPGNWLQKPGCSAGLSVPREKLVAEGVLQKYFIDEHSAACFEYSGDDCNAETPHFHLKCEM